MQADRWTIARVVKYPLVAYPLATPLHLRITCAPITGTLASTPQRLLVNWNIDRGADGPESTFNGGERERGRIDSFSQPSCVTYISAGNCRVCVCVYI